MRIALVPVLHEVCSLHAVCHVSTGTMPQFQQKHPLADQLACTSGARCVVTPAVKNVSRLLLTCLMLLGSDQVSGALTAFCKNGALTTACWYESGMSQESICTGCCNQNAAQGVLQIDVGRFATDSTAMRRR